MTSHTKINVNTVHLIPALAVWQAPKLLKTLFGISLKTYFVILLTGATLVAISKSTLVNNDKRVMMEDYSLCFARFRAGQSWTTNRELRAGSDRCYAAALEEYHRKQSR